MKKYIEPKLEYYTIRISNNILIGSAIDTTDDKSIKIDEHTNGETFEYDTWN